MLLELLGKAPGLAARARRGAGKEPRPPAALRAPALGGIDRTERGVIQAAASVL